jgi:hypothetical protein
MEENDNGVQKICEELDSIDWYTRQVYAKFGLAIYYCQVVETSMLNILCFLKIKDSHILTKDDLLQYQEILFKKTFGALRIYLEKEKALTNDDMIFLKKLLKLRNFLVHHYFYDRAFIFMKLKGKKGNVERIRRIY